jgi:PST family polysaccharide transporter
MLSTPTQKPTHSEEDRTSYKQILKSTAIIGGSSVVVIILGAIRNKLLAVMVDKAGTGLYGIYDNIVSMGYAVASLGIGMSGVRQISEAVGSGDQNKVAGTIAAVRKAALYLGLIGTVLFYLFHRQICQFTFGNQDNAGPVAILSLAMIFSLICIGQKALLNGLRRIVELAKMNIYGSAAGTVVSIPIIYFYGIPGVAVLVVAMALINMVTAWWLARGIPIPMVQPSRKEMNHEIQSLLKLGVVLISATLMSTGAMLLVRVIVTRQLGIDAAGLFHAASTLSMLYVGFVLQAMGTDFYPRLTGIAKDHAACNRMVNEQVEISVLIAIPGIVATMILSPMVIELFYSKTFLPMMDLLRWQLLGVVLRIASWPQGYILLAKGAAKTYFISECITNAAYILFLGIGIKYHGLSGVGMAFFGMYAIYIILIYFITARMTGFRWSLKNMKLALVLFPLVFLAFLVSKYCGTVVNAAVGSVLILVSFIFVYRETRHLFDLRALAAKYLNMGRGRN